MKVTGHDNRGMVDYPWGFVYFDDDTRVVYAVNEDLFPFQGPHWVPATEKHVELARAYLAGVFPGVSFEEKKEKDAG